MVDYEDSVPLDQVGSIEPISSIETIDEKDQSTEELEIFRLQLRNKKKKRRRPRVVEENDSVAKGTYTYAYMLNRVMRMVHENNPNLVTDNNKYRLCYPQMGFLGAKKTVWVNFERTCKLLHRNLEHVKAYFEIELNAYTSLDKINQLIIKARLRNANNVIRSILLRYIEEYVRCKLCHKPNTYILHDSKTRLNFLVCDDCGAKYTVGMITSLYRARTRRTK
uniref:Translation initiation factor 2, beta subunit n=1 Tax=Pithovirus LCPAC404 TaxID=2506597 RepID=A0A481ZDL6_9VIRU|nr:MAG: translation initiation factor 2, beta subunit [Pithovirus LCPAC404]